MVPGAAAAVALAIAALTLARQRAQHHNSSQLPLPAHLSVLIKNRRVPAIGIVCSKPSRARFFAQCLFDGHEHVDFGWGLDVYIGRCCDMDEYAGLELFVASVPMGDSGSYLCFRELFSAGARFVCRVGSSDYQVGSITEEHAAEVWLVRSADNLVGVMRDGGYAEHEWGGEICASSALLSAVQREATRRAVGVKLAVCHNTANYHATNFPFLESAARATRAEQRWRDVVVADNTPHHTSDMESAALFLAARESGAHAVTLLQRIRKTGGHGGGEDINTQQQHDHLQRLFLPLVLASLRDAAAATTT